MLFAPGWVRDLGRAHLEREPLAHVVLPGLLTPRHARQLAESFPTTGFLDREGSDGEKTWRNRVRNLIPIGEASANLDGLAPAWRRLAAALLAPAYRRAVSHATGADLSALALDANFFRYDPGHWLGPHLDIASKVVTQLFYFNLEWPADWGGDLRLLHSQCSEDVFRSVSPAAGTSVILVRSDRSWHEVAPVAGAGAERCSLQVSFWVPEARQKLGSMPYR